MMPSHRDASRPVRPLVFPASDPRWEMSESHRHSRLCETLYQVLLRAAGPDATVGADMFVYFDAANARRKCAPDGFVKLGVTTKNPEVWKCWEHGAPELVVEVLSPSDTKEKLSMGEKLRRFHAMGTREVIAFNVEAPAGQRLQAWDRVGEELVSRGVAGDTTPCRTLGLHFVVAPCVEEDELTALRLAASPHGDALVPTRLEEEKARVAVLEAELARARSSK